MIRCNARKGMNRSVERRYEFIEFRLYWQGNINRSDLMDAFGISVQQASKDLANYSEGCKANLFYDKQRRTYLRGKDFEPRYFQADSAEYFSQLQAIESGLVSEGQSWISYHPSYAATPLPARGVYPNVLREILTAIKTKRALKLTYQSMSRAEPLQRWIEPHALAFDGFRWHTRAFCQNDKVFKDFLLSRIIKVEEFGELQSASNNDADWRDEITITIGPHPGLSPTQKRVIEMDYGMTNGQTELVIRKSLLFYTLRRLGLDADVSTRSPLDQQIVLLDRSDQSNSMKCQNSVMINVNDEK